MTQSNRVLSCFHQLRDGIASASERRSKGEERRLKFNKDADMFDARCVDRIGALTIDRRPPGVYLPPLTQGEQAIINLLRIKLPDEIFLASCNRSRPSNRQNRPIDAIGR